jgi:hypothetical protein
MILKSTMSLVFLLNKFSNLNFEQYQLYFANNSYELTGN